MDLSLPEPVRTVARQQYGVVSRRQLRASGVTQATIRWAVGRRWRALLPGVLLLDSALPTDLQRCMAAQLAAGAGSWLSGPTAAALHGLPGLVLEPPLHVLVAAPRHPRRLSWVTIRSTSLTDERIVSRGPLRLSCRPRSLVDAAAEASTQQARSMVIEAVHQRLVRLDDVGHWIEVRENAGRPRLRAALAEASAGAWSRPEAELAALMRTSTVLPSAWANPELVGTDGRRLTTPDLWIDEVAVAVMVHSRRFHAGSLDWEATVAADSELQLYGVIVVGVAPESIARDPAGVLRRVERAYQAAAALDRRAQVVATPRKAVWGRPVHSG